MSHQPLTIEQTLARYRQLLTETFSFFKRPMVTEFFTKLPFYLLLFLIGLYLLLFSAESILNQINFNTGAHDVGVYDQVIWLISRFRWPHCTLGGVNLFGIHVAGYCYLLAPLFWLWDNINMLYLAQSLLLGLTVLPLYFYSERRLKNSWLALIIGASFLLYPALGNMNLENFHPEALIVFFYSMTLYFMLTKNWRWFYLFASLSLIGKEEMGLMVFVLGLYLLLIERERRPGLIALIAGLGYFLLCSRVIMPLANGLNPFSPAQPMFYSHWFAGLANNLFNPAYYWASFTSPAAWTYYYHLLAPVAYLPLLSPLILFLGLPSLAVNVLSGVGYFMSIDYHYNYVLIAVIFFALIESLALVAGWLERFKAKTWLLLAVVLVLLIQAVIFSQRWSQVSVLKIRDEIKNFSSTGLVARRAGLALIPADAKVSVSHSLYPQISHRSEIYLFPNPFEAAFWTPGQPQPPVDGHVDYVGIVWGNQSPDEQRIVRWLLNSSWFKEIYRECDMLVLKRAPATVDKNRGAQYVLYEPVKGKGFDQKLKITARGQLAMLYFSAINPAFRNLLGEVLPVKGAYALEISGYLFLPVSGQYRFELSGPGWLSLEIDGQVVSQPRLFQPGFHRYRIKALNYNPNEHGLQFVVYPPRGESYIVSDRDLWQEVDSATADRLLREYQAKQLVRQAFEARQPNLIVNGSFERRIGNQPGGWQIERWQAEKTICNNVVIDRGPKAGGYSAANEHVGLADSRWVQEIAVKPDTYYRFSGWIKTVGVPRSARGAYLNVDGTTFRTEILYGNNGWHYVEALGRTDFTQTKLKVQCRLGDYGAPNTGAAYFDNIALKEILPPYEY